LRPEHRIRYHPKQTALIWAKGGVGKAVDAQKIKQLLQKEEGEKLDFKACLCLATEGEKKELVKDVTAMANTRGGRGHIVSLYRGKNQRVLGIDRDAFHEDRSSSLLQQK
jgi:predicted HTH transcriptional regulator